MSRPDVQVIGAGEQGIELVTRVPPPALRSYVRKYSGWSSPASQIHPRVMPNADIVLVFNFGAPLVIHDPLHTGADRPFRTLLSGLRRTYAGTRYDGATGGFQLDLRPLGAHLLLGIPMYEITDRMIDIDELGDPEWVRLATTLPELDTWAARFDLVDAMIGRRLAAVFDRGPAGTAGVGRALQLLTASAGQVDIDRVVSESEFSHRHLISLFREQVGVPPKLLGRILRFQRATRMLSSGYPHGLGTLAADCGFYDQAHMVREFRSLGGCTPGGYLDSIWPQLDLEVDAHQV